MDQRSWHLQLKRRSCRETEIFAREASRRSVDQCYRPYTVAVARDLFSLSLRSQSGPCAMHQGSFISLKAVDDGLIFPAHLTGKVLPFALTYHEGQRVLLPGPPIARPLARINRMHPCNSCMGRPSKECFQIFLF
jgi:hypothetical protein